VVQVLASDWRADPDHVDPGMQRFGLIVQWIHRHRKPRRQLHGDGDGYFCIGRRLYHAYASPDRSRSVKAIGKIAALASRHARGQCRLRVTPIEAGLGPHFAATSIVPDEDAPFAICKSRFGFATVLTYSFVPAKRACVRYIPRPSR